jgi:uncharacterized membrane protein
MTLAFLDDQRFILKRDIPLEVALFFLAFFLVVVALAVWGYRAGGSKGEGVIRATSAVLSVLGLGVAGYIAYKTQIDKGSFQCIGGGGGCELVEQSKYANFLGVHMSIWGLIGYTTILAAALSKGDLARLAAFGLALFGFIVSLILRYLELWQIHASCQWCVASAVLMTSLLVLATCRLVGFYGLDGYDDEMSGEPDAEGSGDPAPETA